MANVFRPVVERQSDGRLRRLCAIASRLRRAARRRCVLTPAEVVRDAPTFLSKKIEDLREAGESMFDRPLNIPRSGRSIGDAQERT
jgi:hypothetical protein